MNDDLQRPPPSYFQHSLTVLEFTALALSILLLVMAMSCGTETPQKQWLTGIHNTPKAK